MNAERLRVARPRGRGTRGRRRERLVLGAAALAFAFTAALLAGTPARAEYPERPVRIVVPFTPGGGTDLVARTLAEAMARDLHGSVIVDNRPGAGTILGTGVVAGSPPDGYTLLVGTFAYAVNPSLNDKLPYDAARAFAPVGLVAKSFNVVVVPAASPFRSLADLTAYAKANPGKLNYGSFGIGTSAHLAGELYNHLAGVQVTHVPFRGAAPAITDLLGGRIDVMFTTVASVVPHIQSGAVRALAVTAARRVPAFADVPTVSEAGVPGYVADSWYGLYAPAGTPAAIIARLNASVAQSIKSEAFRRVEEVEGLVLSPGSPEDLDAYVRGEGARWREVIKAANIKP